MFLYDIILAIGPMEMFIRHFIVKYMVILASMCLVLYRKENYATYQIFESNPTAARYIEIPHA